jgi:chaperone required for assembly of F1-ATPase
MSAYTVEEAPDGFAVCRDGMALETLAGAPLVVPTAPLAGAIAEEQPRTRHLDPKGMPLLQLAATAINIVAKTRDRTIQSIMAYADSELLCHRAEQPPALVKEQQKIWQPLLDWSAKHLNAPLRTGTGVMPIAQPPESLATLRKVIEVCDAFRLTGVSQAVTVSGSLILGLALGTQHITAGQACAASELDMVHQMKDWGDDPAIRARHETTQRELALCERWFALLHGDQK